MVAGEPFDQEIEATTAAFGANAPPPRRPAPDQVAEAHEAPDLAPRGVLDQPSGRPVAVQTANRLPTSQHGAEELFVDVVVPDVRKPRHSGTTVALDRVSHGLTVPPGAAATEWAKRFGEAPSPLAATPAHETPGAGADDLARCRGPWAA